MCVPRPETVITSIPCLIATLFERFYAIVVDACNCFIMKRAYLCTQIDCKAFPYSGTWNAKDVPILKPEIEKDKRSKSYFCRKRKNVLLFVFGTVIRHYNVVISTRLSSYDKHAKYRRVHSNYFRFTGRHFENQAH